jgi:hypothetical protein
LRQVAATPIRSRRRINPELERRVVIGLDVPAGSQHPPDRADPVRATAAGSFEAKTFDLDHANDAVAHAHGGPFKMTVLRP